MLPTGSPKDVQNGNILIFQQVSHFLSGISRYLLVYRHLGVCPEGSFLLLPVRFGEKCVIFLSPNPSVSGRVWDIPDQKWIFLPRGEKVRNISSLGETES